jgi:hypothetical protein
MGVFLRFSCSCSCSNFARWLLSVARAFQPEICASAFGMPGDRRCGAGKQFRLTRSREGAKGNAGVRGVFGDWRHPCRAPGHLRTRLACGAFSVAWAFQPEHLAVRF